MAGPEFDALVADIKANGQREPIIIHEGKILDGGNRYRACMEAGIAPETIQYGGGNIVSYVLSANLHRRHLSAGQQAAIVAICQDWQTAQTVGKPKSCNLAPLATSADRASVSGVSERTQKDADKVAKADPELARQVAHGEVSLPKAVAQVEAKKPKKKKPNPLKPEPEPIDEELAEVRKENGELHTFCSEQGKIIKELLAENESLGTVDEADDKLAAALAEAKKFREQVRLLTERINGLVNAEAQHIKSIKYWKGKFERLEKSVGKGAAK